MLYTPYSAAIKDFLMGLRKEIPPVMQYDRERKVTCQSTLLDYLFNN